MTTRCIGWRGALKSPYRLDHIVDAFQVDIYEQKIAAAMIGAMSKKSSNTGFNSLTPTTPTNLTKPTKYTWDWSPQKVHLFLSRQGNPMEESSKIMEKLGSRLQNKSGGRSQKIHGKCNRLANGADSKSSSCQQPGNSPHFFSWKNTVVSNCWIRATTHDM